jgi:hypothetical protein
MANNKELEETKKEVFSSLLEIFEGLDRIANSLIAARRNEARWVGILAGGLVLIFAGQMGGLLIFNMYQQFFTENPIAGVFLVVFGPLVSLFVGNFAYMYARKRYTKQFVSWKDTVQHFRRVVTERDEKDVNVIEKTLQLMDQMSGWLPKLLNYKNDEAVAYGFGAFLLVAFVSLAFEVMPLGLLFALLIGTIVWIYFRYEKRKEADQQIREFKNWKQKFEEGKASFLETM